LEYQQRDAPGAEAARRRETLWVSALLLALLVLFFGEAIFGGRKLLPADIAFTDPVFALQAPAEFAGPHNVLLYDQAYQFYPWRAYSSTAIRRGWLPFWNPYIYCGAPFLAEDQPAVFYPVNLLSYALSPADALLFSAMVRLFVAGLATYWYVRTVGRGRFGALVSSVTFTFSGFMVVWLGHPHTNVAAWLPGLFLTLEWLANQRSRRHVAALAVVTGMHLTGGHAETALYTLTAGGLYYCFRVITSARKELGGASWPRILRDLVAFGMATSLGFGLALVQLVPFWQWLQESAELQYRSGVGGLRASRLGPRYWVAGLLPLVLPNIFGNPTWPGDYRSFFPGWNYVEQTLYVGVIGLALAMTTVLRRLAGQRHSARPERPLQRRAAGPVLFHAALAILALGAALRVPVFDWVNHLPLFSIAAYGRLRLIFSFSVSVLAGFGAGALFHPARGRRTKGLAVGALLLLGVTGALVWRLAPGVLVDLTRGSQRQPIREMVIESIGQAFHRSNVTMYSPVLVAAIAAGVLWVAGSVLLRTASARDGRTMATKASGPWKFTLVCLMVLDLFAMGRGYHTTIDAELAFPETPAIDLLRADPETFRVVATNLDLMPNTCMMFGLHDVRGLDFPIDRYRELSLALGARDWLGYGLLYGDQLNPRLLGLLNVKYVLSSVPLSADVLASLRRVGEDGGLNIYENLEVLPRAFVVHRARVHSDPGDAVATMLDTGFALDQEVVIERAAPPWFDQQADPPPASASKARISDYGAVRVGVEVEAAANGFLFLSDTYYPDWQAYVDGARTDIYRADHSFRAVPVTRGPHLVEFVYEPSGFRAASSGSVLSLGTVLLLVLTDGRGRRRPEERLE
jgi:hypothetical protein